MSGETEDVTTRAGVLARYRRYLAESDAAAGRCRADGQQASDHGDDDYAARSAVVAISFANDARHFARRIADLEEGRPGTEGHRGTP